jgi:antitoxin (DNA-binding transcriptional repressor) of toxin-antitoxin stability system
MDKEQISRSEFKARALEFLRQVEVSGKSMVITDRGRSTVEIRHYRADKREPLEILKGSVIEFKDPLEPVATDDWEALV